MDAFGKIQDILINDAALVPLYERGSVFVRKREIKGIVRRSIGPDPDYTNAYIAAE
jgi:ABC-type oligopeptide transport system substrate-binding subunit